MGGMKDNTFNPEVPGNGNLRETGARLVSSMSKSLLPEVSPEVLRRHMAAQASIPLTLTNPGYVREMKRVDESARRAARALNPSDGNDVSTGQIWGGISKAALFLLLATGIFWAGKKALQAGKEIEQEYEGKIEMAMKDEL